MEWNEAFRRKVMSADEAVSVIRSGDHVWVHAGCNAPVELTHAMTARAGELEGVEVTHLMVLGKAEYAAPEHARSFRHRAVFTGANVRDAVADGRADYVPVFLSEIPRLIYSGLQPVDVALIHVSPPDEHGFCSYGVGVECTKAAAEAARTVIALVNRRMPRALGDSFIHVSKLSHADWLCPVHCTEPARCPVTRAPRTWEMRDTLAEVARHGAHSARRGTDQDRRHKGAWLLGWQCHRHGWRSVDHAGDECGVVMASWIESAHDRSGIDGKARAGHPRWRLVLTPSFRTPGKARNPAT